MPVGRIPGGTLEEALNGIPGGIPGKTLGEIPDESSLRNLWVNFWRNLK